jgi:hypothetical protein
LSAWWSVSIWIISAAPAAGFLLASDLYTPRPNLLILGPFSLLVVNKINCKNEILKNNWKKAMDSPGTCPLSNPTKTVMHSVPNQLKFKEKC